MTQRFLAVSAAALLFSSAAFAQILNDGVPDSFQVRYASNLNIGDSVVNITNTGSSILVDPTPGTLCVNLYTFDPGEELISCCTCTVTPDGLQSLSVRSSLISNPLTGEIPNAVVIKMVATTSTGAPCDAASVTAAQLAPGLAAWGTTIHALPVTPGSPATTYGETETAFTISSLSAPELAHLTTTCGFILTDGSGSGICKGCATGGLGGVIAP
jgi:hypothetical protein